MKITEKVLEEIKNSLKGEYDLWWSDYEQKIMANTILPCNRGDIEETIDCVNGCQNCSLEQGQTIFFENAIYASLRDFLKRMSKREKIFFIDYMMK